VSSPGIAPPPTARAGRPDAVLAAAVEQARSAAEAEATEPGVRGSSRVGEHLGVAAEGERLVVHRFACADPAYRGWVWTVELARAPRAKVGTVDDVVLLPAAGALLAPPWIPYDRRVLPGDLGVGDVLPTLADDERLVPTRADAGPWADDRLWEELGLGRARVLSAYGRDEAADRWFDSEAGPDSPLAKAAPAPCGECGFWVRLVGGLGRLYGACANVFAPDDGRVVAASHGCGAHSEAVATGSGRWGEMQGEADPLDTEALEAVVHPAGSVSDSTPPEPYGHS